MAHRQEIRALLGAADAGDLGHREAVPFWKRFIADLHKCIGSEVDGPSRDGSTGCVPLATYIDHRKIRNKLTRGQINPLSMQSEESRPCSAHVDHDLRP